MATSFEPSDHLGPAKGFLHAFANPLRGLVALRFLSTLRSATCVGLQAGRANRTLRHGNQEVLWHRGYKFLTVVYQIDEGVRRLLWVGEDRKTRTLLKFFGSKKPSCWSRSAASVTGASASRKNT